MAHQALVVDEQHDGGHRDDAVFFVGGGGGVVELEAFLELAVDGRRGVLEGGLQDAVELAGAGDVLRALADLERLLEHVIDGAAGLGGAGDEGRVVEEKQFLAHVFGGFFEARGAVGSGVIEIEFVQHDEAGFFLLKDGLGDLAVHRGDACGEVDDEHAEVGAADGFLGAHGGEDLHRVVALAARAQAGGVDEGEVLALEGVGQIDRVAGGAGDFGNDGALVLEDGVDERGLAGVGLADDGELDADGFRDFGDGFGFRDERGDDLVDFIAELAEIAAVFGGDEDAGFETEAREIGEGAFRVSDRPPC